MGTDRKPNRGVLALGAVPVAVSMLVLAGWYLDVSALVRLSPSLPVMQAQTAIGFMFAGLAVLAVARGHDGASAILALATAAIGALAMAGYFLGVPPVLNALLQITDLADGTIQARNMAPKSGLAFFLSGIGVLSLAIRVRSSLPAIAAFVAASAVVLLAVEDLGKFAGEAFALSPRTLKQMALHTATTFLAIGGALALLARARLIELAAQGWRTALGCALVVLAVAGFAAHSVRANQVDSVRRLTRLAGEQTARQVTVLLEARREAVRALAGRFTPTRADSAEWTAFAAALAGHVAGVRSVAWHGGDGRVRWAVNDRGNERSFTLPLEFPAVVGDRIDGVVVAQLDLDTLLAAARAHDAHFGASLAIGDVRPEDAGPLPGDVDPVFVERIPLSLSDELDGTLLIWPSPELLNAERRPLPLSTLLLGTLLAGVLAVAVQAATIARSRAAGLADALESLAAETAVRRRAEAALEQSELRLRESQKMEAVARLAGGVAHHFNNLLSVVRGYADLLGDATASADQAGEYAAEIRRAADRGAELTRSLLTMSGSHVLHPRTIDMRHIIADNTRTLGKVLGDGIELRIRMEDADARVLMDPGPFVHALTTLATNARDAMPSGGRFTLTLRSRGVPAAEAAVFGIRPGSYVELEVADTGIGMNADTRARLFEPFGQAAVNGPDEGLGLAMLYGFVRQSGGAVEVETGPDFGSVFRLLLPKADGHVASEPAPARVHLPHDAKRVLLVEDEDAVRRLTARILERDGFEVIAARDGNDAIALVGDRLAEIDLVLTDVAMPGMDGHELVRRLRAQRDDLPVLFMSGYTGDAIVSATPDAASIFVQKPFEARALVQRIRGLLRSDLASPLGQS